MHRTSLLALAVLAPFLLGADGCPITVGTGGEGAAPTSGSSLDVGGTAGALWHLQFDKEAQVTLRLAGGQAEARKVPLGSGLVDLLGATIDVGSFCWRSDLVCPHSVLNEQTPIQQPSGGAVLVGFNRRGPLTALRETALPGRLDGSELAVPLAVGQAAEGFCALRSASAVLATANASSDGRRADGLQGRVTVSYDGVCASLGGAALPADSQLELSVGFSGKRL